MRRRNQTFRGQKPIATRNLVKPDPPANPEKLASADAHLAGWILHLL